MKSGLPGVFLLILTITAAGCRQGEPSLRKMTALEAAELLSFEVGAWETTMLSAGPDGEETRQLFHVLTSWKERGKSVVSIIRLREGPGANMEIDISQEQEYHPRKGLIIARKTTRYGDRTAHTAVEITHRSFHPATRTIEARRVSPEVPAGHRMKVSTRLIGSDRSETSWEWWGEGKLLSSRKFHNKRVKLP